VSCEVQAQAESRELIPFEDVFWRRNCPRSGWGGQIFDACRKASYDQRSQFVGSMMCSIVDEYLYLLDGECVYLGGWGNGLKGVRIRGLRVERYVCYALGIEQPPLRRGERRIPAFEELLAEIEDQKREAAAGRLSRPETADELGLTGTLTFIGSRKK
jgi:hypothetical protein